jgi:hypothetical protein
MTPSFLFVAHLFGVVLAWQQIGGDSGRQTYQSTRVSVPLPTGVGATLNAQLLQNASQQNVALPSERNGAVWFTGDDALPPASGAAYVAKAVNGVLVCSASIPALAVPARDLGTPAVCVLDAADASRDVVVVAAVTEVLAFNATDCQPLWQSALPSNDTATRVPGEALTRQPPGAVCDVAHNRVLVQTLYALHSIALDSGFEQFATPVVRNATGMSSSPAHGLAPAVCGDWVYTTALSANSGRAEVTAINATSGDVRWQVGHSTLTHNVSSPSVTHPVLDDACARLYFGTSVGVYELNATDGGVLSNSTAQLGLCGALSIQLVTAPNESPLLVTAADTQFAPLNDTGRCIAANGVVAYDLAAQTIAWQQLGYVLSDAIVVASSERNFFWCEGGALYGMSAVNNSVQVSLNAFVGCSGAVITDGGQVVVNDATGFSWYTIGVPPPSPPPSPAPPTPIATPVPTPPPTPYPTPTAVPVTNGTDSTTSTVTDTTVSETTAMPETTMTGDATTTTNFIEGYEHCLRYLLQDCMPRFCPSEVNLNGTWKNVTCVGVECQLFCLSRPESNNCSSFLTEVCHPPPPACVIDCNATYADKFQGSTTTETPIFMSGSTDTHQATNSPTPNNSIWIAVGVSIGVFWLIVMAVIVYCVIKHRQDKNRYVLLELDDDQEAMP